MICAFVNFDTSDWDKKIIQFEAGYNSPIHSTTGFIPSFLRYGTHPGTTPIETLASPYPAASDFVKNIQRSMIVPRDSIKSKSKTVAKYANTKRTPKEFTAEGKVWLSIKNLSLEDGSGNRKLHPKYFGPLKSIRKLNEVTAKLNLPQATMDRKSHNAFHISILKPFCEDKFGRTIKALPPVHLKDGQENIEAEKILSHKRNEKNSVSG